MKTNIMPKTIAKWVEKNEHMIDEAFMEFEDGAMEGHDYQCWICLKSGWITWGYNQHDFAVVTVDEFRTWIGRIVPEGKDADGNWTDCPA